MVKGSLREIRLDPVHTPFNLNHTLNCGQTFRWEKHGEWWHGIVAEGFIQMRQADEALQFQTLPDNIDENFLRNYFRLEDDLPGIYSRIMKDRHVQEAVERFRGLRLVRQDPWECLMSFICATNKNIPAIKDMISNMCLRFGKRVEVNGSEFHAFPSPEALAFASLEDLKLCKLGFRAERVRQTAKLVFNGEVDLAALKAVSYDVAKEQLMNLPGVGPKVADCVLLFSFDHLEAFPVDVWIKRIITEFYGPHFDQRFIEKVAAKNSLSPSEYETIRSFGRDYWGECVGYAQEYLYHFKRCQ